MKILRSLADIAADARGGAVTVGNFDGVHRGHAAIIARLTATARAMGGPAVVLTFDPHPVTLLRPDRVPPPLSWTDRKAELLADLSVDATFFYPTDQALLNLTPEAFFSNILIGQLHARALVEGQNFFFGKNRAGDVQRLAALASAAGIPLEVVPAVQIDGSPVSSSRIRALVAAGNVEAAGRLLTRPYCIRGLVEVGARRGRSLGFPTANLGQLEAMLPAPGVYAGSARVYGAPAGTPRVAAAINVGGNPTFNDTETKVEAHLLDFNGDLYGQRLEVEFLRRIRDTRGFASVQALREQLLVDIAAARLVFDESRQAAGGVSGSGEIPGFAP